MQTYKTLLITGIGGSGGSYFAEHILATQPRITVHGIVRRNGERETSNLKTIRDAIHISECDMNDVSALYFLLHSVKPDAIIHFASSAHVKTSFAMPLAVIQNNVMGTANLFEAIRMAGIQPLIHLISTSEVYGQVDPLHIPITEDCPLNPSSPYAVSKVAQDLLGYAYARSYDMKIIRTRMFSYLNPRRDDLFTGSFAKQIARIETGLQKELLHGNLDSIRTLIDFRDAMDAYWVATTHGRPGEVYNIGGNTVISVGEFLETLRGMAHCPIPVRYDPSLKRPSDVTLQIPDTNKFRTETGWQARYTFQESIKYLLEYWRDRIHKEYAKKT